MDWLLDSYGTEPIRIIDTYWPSLRPRSFRNPVVSEALSHQIIRKSQLYRRSEEPHTVEKNMTETLFRKKPGMASVKDMPVLQDGPPPGGFPPVRFARRIPNKGPSAVAIFLATFGAFSWGMYQVGKGNKIRRMETASCGFLFCLLVLLNDP
ncbi:GRIM-19 protein [Actinidia rufa]|uniref:NADH dehydrogenase [ubiquinone] 1 alpha subcomplex subunit 13 n=1 Tax=Actinidia rufa TaxID=165716 RepID=A0A7J0DTR5_9ERIC|nr:GRIM-19 protein [Actinidia rufa]